MRQHADVERFVRGEAIAVEVGEIERALGELWQQASASSRVGEPGVSPGEPVAGGVGPSQGPPKTGGQTTAVSRAALWNAVFLARGRGALATAKQLVDEIAPALPTRALTLCLDDERSSLDATIESNVVSQPGGARVVYSEEITISGPASAERHFGALVRALQIAGVPTATFWLDPAAPESLLSRELLAVTDRLVFDTTACVRPEQLFDVERIATTAQPLPITDMGWLRLGALRALFAGMFDPPIGGAPLVRARKITIEHRAGCDPSALLLLAWIGVQVGWRPLRAAQTSDGGVRFDFARAGQPISGHLVPADGPCGRSGILGVTLETGDDRYALRRTALDQTLLQIPGVPPKPVKLDSPSDAELAVAALGSRGRDPLFVRCLSYARHLWSLEPDTAGSRR